MIAGIGIDIARIERIARLHERYGAMFLDRVFTAFEKEYCLSMADAAPSLAARWAAKEAFYKALPPSCKSYATWKSVSIVHGEGTIPAFVIHEALLKTALAKESIASIHLSMSHEKDNAIALVIMERSNGLPTC